MIGVAWPKDGGEVIEAAFLPRLAGKIADRLLGGRGADSPTKRAMIIG